MSWCEKCELSSCHHMDPEVGRRYDSSLKPILTEEDLGHGPTIEAKFPGACANCGTAFEEKAVIRHILMLPSGDAGWIAECCIPGDS